MRNTAGIILGGGQGVRLMPLTRERAKPAVGFAGKYRLIDIAMSNCINSGIKRLFVLTQFLSASLHRHIMQTYQFDTFTDGFVDILAAEQTGQSEGWFQGTADAVRATLHHTTYFESEQMLVLAGDHLYRMDFGPLVRSHRESKADITLCVQPVPRAEATRLGLLSVDRTGAVESFVEKPSDPAVIDRFVAPEHLFERMGVEFASGQCLASMGIYVFEPHVLREMLEDTSHTDFGSQIIPAAIGRYRVQAWPFTGYWKDIGTVGSFYEANIALAQPDPSYPLYQPRWPIYTRARSLAPSRVVRSEIRDCLLVEGSDITGAHIEDSIVGMRSIVRQGSHLKGVVMLGCDFYEGEQDLDGGTPPKCNLPPMGIGRHCIIERAIIDKNARIGDGVVIRDKTGAPDLKAETHWVRDGITIIPKGVVIPPRTEI
ncbi:glucose-1-phosphate adenylyltransferase [Candidatus Sumerlaeota bacterium]|nr:glucose-1-phosphate adenylyltransferase [Candidatus Sumerlaeota bacterium]